MKHTIYKDTTLSTFCLGTVQLGMEYGISNTQGKPSSEEANKILDSAIKSGINCFDTASAYQNSENILGDYQEANSKDFMNIITKIGSDEFSTSAIQSLNSSLKALKTDTAFALLLHDSKVLHSFSDKEEKILKTLKIKKMIKHFGISIYTDEEFQLAVNNPHIDIIQIPFNLFDTRAHKQRWFEKAKKADKLIFIRSVFLQGLFFMSHDTLPKNLQDAAPYLKQLNTLTQTLQCDTAELALSFVFSSAPEAIIILGCETNAQLLENISLFKTCKPLKENILKKIDEQIKQVPENIYNPALWSR